MFKLAKKIRNILLPTARIFLYHRVADAKSDPRLLCVSPEKFRVQMKFLKENFKILPLVKLVEDISAKKLQGQNIAITFDDGYADNLYNALPILEEFNIPATIFLTAGYIGKNRSFYWDENTPLEDRGRPMTIDEAKTLSRARIVEIGGHAISHLKLAKIPENDQFGEIADGKRIIEEMIGLSLSGFAYPFGGEDSFDKDTIELVKRAGYRYACANIHKMTTNRSNIFALPRFVIRNWDLKEFKKKLNSFLL